MSTLLLGSIFMASIIFFSNDKDSWQLFLNMHSIYLVFGGTAAILLMLSPPKVLKAILQCFKLIPGKRSRFESELHNFESLRKEGRLASPTTDPLMNYSVSLMERGLDAEMMRELILQKKFDLEDELDEAVQTLRAMAKYPPALGMTGTVLGLVKLFSELGSEAAGANIGPALALALTATFFGLILSNGIIMPICDRLVTINSYRKKEMDRTFRLIELTISKKPLTLIREEVQVYDAA